MSTCILAEFITKKNQDTQKATIGENFKVGTTFIEYFGLTGNPDYDAKTKEKIRSMQETQHYTCSNLPARFS